MLSNFGHAQKAKFQVNAPSIFTFYFPSSCYFLFLFPPLFFFSWAFTMLHFGRKSFHENQENCEIISQFTIHNLLFERGKRWIEWSKNLIGIFCSTLHVVLAFYLTCLTELCSFVYSWKMTHSQIRCQSCLRPLK